jgi:nitroreductase
MQLIMYPALAPFRRRHKALAPPWWFHDYPWVDIGIAGEHLVLAATELGLGTCRIGWSKAKKGPDRPAAICRAFP